MTNKLRCLSWPPVAFLFPKKIQANQINFVNKLETIQLPVLGVIPVQFLCTQMHSTTEVQSIKLPWRSFSFKGSQLYILKPFSMPQEKQPFREEVHKISSISELIHVPK